MLVPYPLRCSGCNRSVLVEVELGKTSAEWACGVCGSSNSTYLHSGLPIGFQILARSRYEENERQDYSLSIVLSAMAVDCELSRLFAKWKRLTTGKNEQELGAEEIEKMLRHAGGINKKMREVSQLMHPPRIVDFIISSQNLRDYVLQNFSGDEVRIESIVDDIDQQLFWPRNRILHNAAIDYGPTDARRCLRLATLVLFILWEMDAAKQKTCS